jgi:glycosyltransferase involved in cell wall biosynthesis
MTKKLPTLSVIIHTKDDERNIKDCIQSCPPFTTEFIAADMESSDQTVAIARKLGATILPVKAYGVAEPMRNTAIAAATSEWILVVDSDERLTPALHKIIREIISSNNYDVVAFPRKNIMLGKWIKHGLRWPDYQKRLFRKGFVKWSSVIHAPPVHSGRFHQLPATEKNAFVHFHTRDLNQLLEKTVLQASLERFYDKQKPLSLEAVYHRTMNEFPWRYFEHEGYKDGMHGFITNKYMEIYRFLEFANYWERSGKKELFPSDKIAHLWNREAYLKSLETELTILKSSKIFKIWQAYSRFKDRLLGRIKKS